MGSENKRKRETRVALGMIRDSTKSCEKWCPKWICRCVDQLIIHTDKHSEKMKRIGRKTNITKVLVMRGV